jgi:DNA-binding response OmpR family regulator
VKEQLILLVDDEPDFCEMVVYNLRGEGREIITAGDGLEALRLARWRTPDLILLDLMLPELDGLSVCEILRRHPATARIPVILLTACASEPLRKSGLENGVRAYLTKPVNFPELVRCVGTLLAVPGTETAIQLAEQ